MQEANDRSPTISAVVVNHNGGENLINCLQALLEQDTALAEVVVVDNSSTDGSIEKASEDFPSVQIIRLDENLGLSEARNVGLDAIGSDWVLILDDDVYVRHDTVAILHASLVESGAAAACPRILLFPQTDIMQCDGAEAHFIGNMTLRHAYQQAGSVEPESSEVGALIGACMLIRREALKHTDCFNPEYFFYFEDLEFSLRLRALGHKIVCQPEAIVYHEKGSGTPGLSFRGDGVYPERRLFYTLRHRWLTLLLLYQIRTFLVLAPPIAIYEFTAFAITVRNKQIGTWWLAMKSIWRIRKKIRYQRSSIQRKRVIGDRQLLQAPDLFFAPGFISSRTGLVAVKWLSGYFRFYWNTFSALLKK